MTIFMTSGSIRRLAGVFAGGRVRPVIYIRRQDEAIQSFYAELIKGRFTRVSASFSPALLAWIPFFNYYREYLKWAAVFGRENVILRTYNRLHRNDIVEDFLSILEIDKQGLSFFSGEKNPHFNSSSIHALRQANRQGLSDEEFYKLVGQLAKQGDQQKGFDFLTKQELNKLNKRFAASNKKLAVDYFNREQLFL